MDSELLIEKISKCDTIHKNLTQKINKYAAYGYLLITNCSYNSNKNKYDFFFFFLQNDMHNERNLK